MSKYITVEGNGKKYWLQNGKLHREDGPAMEWANGDKFWYINGKKHREDGPAVEWADSSKEWWVNGVKLTKEEFTNKVKNKKLMASEIESLKSYGIEVDI
jgi:hypothetical protein